MQIRLEVFAQSCYQTNYDENLSSLAEVEMFLFQPWMHYEVIYFVDAHYDTIYF